MKAKDTVKRNVHYRCLEYDHDQEGDICLVACGMERCDPGINFGPEVRDCYHLHCWVTYSGDDAKKISEEIGFIDGVYCIDTSADVHEFFELVYKMHEKPEMNYINDLRRRGILLEYLALAMETSKAKTQRAPVRKMYSPEVYVQKAISFIDMNYATIRVGDIVRYIGLTRSYFATIFRKHTGVSPQEYLLQCRFRNGVRLLTETDLPIQVIAEQIGYEDPLNFSKAFKKVYEQSPTAYRKKVQEHIEGENRITGEGKVTANGK